MTTNPYAPPQTEMHNSDDVHAELASRWARLGGSLIDTLLMLAVLMPILFISGFWSRSMEGSASTIETFAWGLLGMIVFLVLQGYLLVTSGQTIGKRLLNMRIVSVEDNQIPGAGKVLGLRYILQFVITQIPIAGGLYGLVDSLFVFREDKRCIHDLMAGTKVISLK